METTTAESRTGNQALSERQTIVLQMSPGMKALYGVCAVLGLLFALASAGALAEAPDGGEKLVFLIGIAFFGGGSLYVLWLLRKQAGRIEIGPQGLLLDTQMATGFVPWGRLAKVGATRIFGVRHLGLQLADVGAFIQSRHGLTGLTMASERALARGFMGGLLAAKKLALADVFTALLGLPKLPESADEASLLEYNAKAWDYHVLVPALWIRDPDAAARAIEGRRPAPAEPARPESPRLVTEQAAAQDAELQKCPMCAETIRVDARVCRYCHYSLAEHRFVA
jgi:hypothetical protein